MTDGNTTTQTREGNMSVAPAVTVLCQVFHPDTQSTSQLLSDALAALARAGQSITVISGYPGMHDGRSLAATEIWQGITIRRGGLRASVKKSLWLRSWTYLSYTLHVAWHLICSRSRCHVLVVTNPPFLPVIAWLVCRLRGHPFKVMLQDVYPEGLVAVGRLQQTGLVNRLWRAANRRAFRAADEVWVLGRDMEQLIRQQYGVPADKVRYLPHWSAVEVPQPLMAERTRLWKRLDLGQKFVVQYSGNMGLWHDVETIVMAAARLKNRAEIQFILIGQGMRRAAAEELSRKLGATNIIWLPYQDREELVDSLSCCHVALISQRAGLQGVAVPCKLYGIMASGRAVVAQVPAGSEVALTVGEETCGRIVAPGDVAGLTECITELAAAREETVRMGVRAHAAYRAKYTLAAGVTAFERGFAEWPGVSSRREGNPCLS